MVTLPASPPTEHLRTYDRQPDDLVFTPPEGGAVQLNVWRQRLWGPGVRDAGVAHLNSAAIYGTPRWRCGWPPAPSPRRSRHGPDTRR